MAFVGCGTALVGCGTAFVGCGTAFVDCGTLALPFAVILAKEHDVPPPDKKIKVTQRMTLIFCCFCRCFPLKNSI